MRREFVVILAAAIAAAACSDGEQAPRPAPTQLQESIPAAAVNEAPCDASNREAAIRTYARLKGIQLTGDPEDYGCATLLPELDAALFGMMATEAGCIWTEVLHGCEILRAGEASSTVLASKGFAGVPEKDRAALAMLWTRKVIFAEKNVLEQATPAFEAQKVSFSAPEAKSDPSGGVEVKLWIGRPPGLGTPGTMEQHVITFRADGAVVSDKVAASIECGIDRSAGPGSL